MAISKRVRYEVLKRDGYRCRYCGISAPDAVITVDHVVPQALGGGDEPSNLVAACKPCNDGKASTSPDAPLVADVAEDALRWSQAMTAAAGEMLARASGDVDAVAHFEKAWARYGTGPRRKPLPKDPGWQNTIGTLLSAGLPMGVLEECIEIAMSQRRVTENNVFRYMCGVAWRKVRELQDRARELTQGDPSAGNGGSEDIEDEAIQRHCSVLLNGCDPGDVEAAKRECRERTECEGPDGVLWFVIRNLEQDREGLRSALQELLQALPAEHGVNVLKEQEAARACKLKVWHLAPLYWTAMKAVDVLALARARQELALTPRTDYAALIQQAREESADFAEYVGESHFVVEAARIAREKLSAPTSEAAA